MIHVKLFTNAWSSIYWYLHSYLTPKIACFKGLRHPKMKIVINHLPSCRSKPIKALFVFGTQFKIF